MIVIDHSQQRPDPCADRIPERRRLLLAGLGALGSVVAGGCASPSLQLLGGSFGRSGKRHDNGGYALSAEQIEAIPYASLGVRVGGSAPVVMILANINGANLHWASADRVVLITERGRLVKTIGMPRDLVGTRWTGSDALLTTMRHQAGSGETGVGRIIDLRPKDDFSVPVESRYQWLGEEKLRLLGQERRSVLVAEQVIVRKWRWKTENRYWFDADSGRMLKSRQQYCPEVPAITLEVLKAAAEPVAASV